MGVHAVILAGGKGERFWPRSRGQRPKQFLRICGEGTLLQQAYRRACRLVGAASVWVVTGVEFRSLVAEQLPDLPAGRILLEPLGRDTAPAIGYAALLLERADPGSTMAVMPADHAVFQEDLFCDTLREAVRAADDGRYLVTVGIRPTRPETGYGYIEVGDPCAADGPVRAVRRFTEKPDMETALRFLSSGEYLWNSGIFVWRAAAVLEAMTRHAPELRAGLAAVAGLLDEAGAGTQCATAGGAPAGEAARPAAGDAPEPGDSRWRRLAEVFGRLPSISIDYAVLEKADNVAVVPGLFGWDDLGSWSAMSRIGQADEAGNVVSGRALLVESRDCIVDGGDRLVVTFGVERLVIVDGGDVVFVGDVNRMDRLKQVLAEMRVHGLEDFLARQAIPAGAAGLAGTDEPAGAAVAGRSAGAGYSGSGPGAPALPEFAALAESAALETVPKPWGREIWWARTDRYVAKLIQVRAGHAMSLQFHRRKRETMLFVSGTGRMLLGDRELAVSPGLVVSVEPGCVHRVEAGTDLLLFEVSTPEVDDVVRLEDRYGRAAALPASGGV